MAKISELPAAGPLTGTETMPIVQGGAMKQAPFADVLDAIDDAGSTQVAAVNTAGGTQVAAVNTAGGAQVAAVNAAGAVQIAGATTQAGLAAAAAATAQEAVGYRGKSARFPLRNRHSGDLSPFAMIAQPTANMGTLFNADGALIVAVTLPRERLRASGTGQSNVYRGILGNVLTGSSANNFYLGITGAAGVFQTQLTFYMRSGAVPLIGPLTVLLPEAHGTRLLLAVRRTGNTLSIDWWDCDTGTKYAGTTADATSFTGLIPVNGGSFFQVGAGGNTNTAPQVPGFNPLNFRAWDGDIGLVGYYAGTMSDAQCQNLAIGTAVETATTPGSWRWVRELDGSTASLTKPAWATGDATSAATEVNSGGLRIERGSDITGKGVHFTVNRKIAGDAHVDGLLPGRNVKAVSISGRVRATLPAADVIEARFLTTEGRAVTDWQRVAAITPGDVTWSGFVNVPKGIDRYVRQLRLVSQRSDPTKWCLDATRFAVGYRLKIFGQSQMANLRTTTRGLQYTGRLPISFVEQAAEAAADISAINCFMVHDRLPAIGDGVFGIMQAIDAAGCDAVVALEIQAVGGTSALDWIDDTAGGRTWNPMLRSNEVMDGGTSVIIWNWDPADIGTSYQTLLDAVFCGTGAQARGRFVFDPTSAGGVDIGATVVYMPTQRTNGSATVESDFDTNGTYGTRRDEGVAWAASKPFAVTGIAPLDLELGDSLHPSMTLASGTERHGQHLGVSFLRGARIDVSRNPTVLATSFAFTDGTRTAFRFDVDLPNFGALRNGLGATSSTGADKGVRLIEVSTDGVTWSKSGFTAVITGRNRVTATKTAGAWSAPAAATGTVTFTAVGTEGDTITVAGTFFTLSATGGGNNEVQIGATATATAQSFRDKVNNLSSTLGVTASGTGTVVTLTSTALSPSANTIALARVSTAVTLSGATLTGGAGLLVRVGWGGFGSYGLPANGITSGNTAARDYWMYDGYARHPNGLGIPVLPTNTIYTVA